MKHPTPPKNPDLPAWASAIFIGLIMLLPIYCAIHIAIAAAEKSEYKETDCEHSSFDNPDATNQSRNRARNNF